MIFEKLRREIIKPDRNKRFQSTLLRYLYVITICACVAGRGYDLDVNGYITTHGYIATEPSAREYLMEIQTEIP